MVDIHPIKLNTKPIVKKVKLPNKPDAKDGICSITIADTINIPTTKPKLHTSLKQKSARHHNRRTDILLPIKNVIDNDSGYQL